MGPEASPRETAGHARPRLPENPARQAEPPAAVAAQTETWAARESDRAERLRADRRTPGEQPRTGERATEARRKAGETQRKKGAWDVPGRDQWSGSRGVGKAQKRPARADLPSTLFPILQGDAGLQALEHHLSRDEIAFARDGFTGRAQNGQSVLVRSPTGAPDDRGVGDVLSEEGGKVWAVVGKFGLEPGLRAFWATLLSVRRAGRDVQGSARVAKGGGEHVGGPEISARDEAGNLGLSGVIAGLGSSANWCGGRVVAGAVSREPVWQATQGTGSLGPAHPRRKRNEST